MTTSTQQVNQLADMFKALGHPLRIQIITVIIEERCVSIPTLQQQLPDVDSFRLYSSLRYMHEHQVVRKIQKGREIYYALSDAAMATGLSGFFQDPTTNRNQVSASKSRASIS